VTRRAFVAAAIVLGVCVSAPEGAKTANQGPDGGVRSGLDEIFSDPILARALLAVRVESLTTGQLLYQRNSEKLVVPASNMKIVTMAVAAGRLGWDFTYETAFEAAGWTDNGVLHGDLVVTGAGDPSIGSHDAGPAGLFLEWADALRAMGIRRVEGRLIGDDNAFSDEPLGAGWAWDYVADGYAAPSGALSYNENVAVVRLTPGAVAGSPATLTLGPPGHELVVTSRVTTGAPGSAVSVNFARLPGDRRVTIGGSVPVGGPVVVRTTSVDNPTRFFIEGLRLALLERGIIVSGGAADIDEIATPIAAGARRMVARHRSESLATIAANFLKVSQNFYGEMILKTLGRTAARPGSTESGRQAVRETMASWDIPADSLVMYDGSGLSRYNYVTADGIVAILKRVWQNERLRGPFVAALPVGGRDGTLDLRMRNTVLDRNVRAKTGTISNVRSLSGYLDTASGETLVFSMIANHFTAPSARIDAVVERALVRLVAK
jgi:D-alanyl-D-alanine carboxypeptidase/D-alanyl-D-alanine-endopeptidase (penicillin-binding protein 4)